MIGHDDEFLKGDEGEMVRDFLPAFFHNLAQRVQPYFFIDDLAEEQCPFVGDNGEEIAAGEGVIVVEKPRGLAGGVGFF